MKKQIFALGGGFYVNPWEEPLLQRHLLSLSEAEEPSICLLATASGDKPDTIEQFYRAMSALPVRPDHLNLFKPSTAEFADYFRGFDIIYVDGGATRNMIALWNEWQIGEALHAAWDSGTILSGTSAGAICWFEACITDSIPTQLLPLDCLGFLGGSCNTHYSARPDRRPTFQSHIASGRLPSPGIAIDDHVALHYIGCELHEIVASQANAHAYRVTRTEQGVIVNGGVKSGHMAAQK